MRRIKKQIISAVFVICFICIVSLSAIAGVSDSVKITSWGNEVQKYAIDSIEENEAVMQSLTPTDDKIILPQIEINQAKDFYLSAGYSDTEAEETAFIYVKEINTLYQEALKNGYAVTDDEIAAHIEQMKLDFQVAENRDEIYEFISSFENEQAYWDFQFEMLRKDLPIQRYVADKEKEFIRGNDSSNSSIASNDAVYFDSVLEAQDEWVDQFEAMKDEAEEKYEYIVE